MYGLLVGFGLMFDKGQKQSSTLSWTALIIHCCGYDNLLVYP